ncbi:MAG: nicotinate-nucleotide adenylyltransferase [Deltaproteobacteria bacterium]|nr:nicotinate-nucleotide adenylyltransferase [Deltaproteobacteria bacterium]
MRIAVMGGTFNPIHLGHLRIAEEVREYLNIDRVMFIPTFMPPHKNNGSLIPSEDRLEMARLAIKGNPNFQVSDIEIKRGGRSYSIETLQALQKDMPNNEISFIIGTDQFNEITTWCEYERLFELTNFIVVTRHGYPVKKIGEVLPDKMARQFTYDPKKDAYVHKNGKTVTYLATTLMDISASQIRQRIKDERSIRYLMPQDVERYIVEKGLYR